MFRLTKQEQLIVAFVLGAIVLGTTVKQWRARHEEDARAPVTVTRER
jgi:hypothetical protein